MKFWSMSYPCFLLLFIITTLLFYSTAVISPSYIFVSLLYLCLHLTAHIVRKDNSKAMILFLSVLLVITSSIYIHPMFILLFPSNMVELVTNYLNKYRYVTISLAIPLFFLNQYMLVLYIFIAIVSFSYYALLKRYTTSIAEYRKKIESLNDKVDALTRSLSDYTEYKRQSEYTIKLEERNRISQEIHDKVGHSMTGALIQMEASKRLLNSDLEHATQLLQNAIIISKEGIESIRLVLKNTKPPLEQLGINRVRLLVDEFSSKHTISTTFRYEGDVDLIMPIHWSIIMGNIKEALTNVMKYAKATNVTIHIQVLRTLIKIVIADNGKGTDKVIKGLGITGMEERAASIDGTVIVDGSSGFSVTTLLPISFKQHKS